MPPDHQQSWRLIIRAKLKTYHINLKTHKLFLPSSKSFQFSTKFKIHNVLITVKSKPKTSFASKFNSFKYKLIQPIKRLQIRRSNKAITSTKWFTITTPQGSNNGESSWLGGDLARFGESILRKDRNGIVKFGSIIGMFLASGFYSYLRRNRFSLLLVLVIGMLISGGGGYISSYVSFTIAPLLEFILTFL